MKKAKLKKEIKLLVDTLYEVHKRITDYKSSSFKDNSISMLIEATLTKRKTI